MKTKICTKCKVRKPLSEFHKGEGRFGKRSYCRTCSTKYNNQWRKKNPEKHKAQSLKHHHSIRGQNTYYKRMYGITIQEYDNLFELQNGKCAICGGTNINRRLSVDHNHKTGKFRGLLCHSCNVILGLCKESEKTLLALINYLRESI